MRLVAVLVLIVWGSAAWGQSSQSGVTLPSDPKLAAQVHREVLAYVARKGMSEAEFAKSIGDNVSDVEGLAYSGMVLGTGVEETLDSLVDVHNRHRP